MIGKVKIRDIETKVIRPTWNALAEFSREELRRYCIAIGVQRGRNKADTIRNLLDSGKASLLAQLGN